ncbi:MAG: DUF3149 domain-containing protein [Gammaproteobacteria bacterium]|nr:DUF3149 domain-containing protein [Gammaproteobacteria bacterium]
MDLWMNLLFGNPIGLSSMIVVLTTFLIIGYISVMFITKSGKHHH